MRNSPDLLCPINIETFITGLAGYTHYTMIEQSILQSVEHYLQCICQFPDSRPCANALV